MTGGRRAALALVTLSLVTGCLSPPERTSLLLVSLDTTRADRLSAYGYGLPTSPRIEELASRGAVFTRAYTHAPTTLPAHASLLTGLLPPRHGVRANARFLLSDEHATLAEILGRAGWATGAFVASMPLDRKFGLAQGFDVYDGDFSSEEARSAWLGHPVSTFERDAAEVTDRALAWLGSREDPFFLFVHYFDPHAPYREHPGVPALEDPYDEEIAFADRQLGRLLDAVAARGEEVLVVVVADHGEGLGEHGEDAHGRYLYESTLRIPLVFAMEGRVPRGVVFDTPVALVDVLPTVLDLLGIEEELEGDGRSLEPLLLGEGALPPRPIYSETMEWSLGIDEGIQVRSLVEGRHKLVRTDVREDEGGFTVLELYDVEADPAELENLARREPTLRDRLAGELRRWSGRLESEAFEAEEATLDDHDLRSLRALGYLE